MLVKFIGGPKAGQHMQVEDGLQTLCIAVSEPIPAYVFSGREPPKGYAEFTEHFYKRTKIMHGGAVYFTWQG